jgi:hypothetical protein
MVPSAGIPKPDSSSSSASLLRRFPHWRLAALYRLPGVTRIFHFFQLGSDPPQFFLFKQGF